MGFFKKISDALKRTKESFSRKLDYIFSHGELNEDFYEELCEILISCDVGYNSSEEICDRLRQYARKNKIRKSEDVKKALKIILKEMIDEVEKVELKFPCVITIVGVNGVGKTTAIGKLANLFKKNKKDVLLVAGDTFRAAASKQLAEWAERSKVRIVKHEEGADAGAVVFDGIASAKSKNNDVLIIDTAGRLHTKTDLMGELSKINKIIDKEYSNASKYTFLVIDATTGQNALNQLEIFNEYIHIDGIILTKLDGTAKGGVVIPISHELKLPVLYIGTGEQIDDIEEFDSSAFVDNLY